MATAFESVADRVVADAVPVIDADAYKRRGRWNSGLKEILAPSRQERKAAFGTRWKRELSALPLRLCVLAREFLVASARLYMLVPLSSEQFRRSYALVGLRRRFQEMFSGRWPMAPVL